MKPQSSDPEKPGRGRLFSQTTATRSSFRIGAVRWGSDESLTGRWSAPEVGSKGGDAAPENEEPQEHMDGVYIISVAARILDMHPQTLRKYERMGLVTPSRTVGMLRLYSEEDIARLGIIKHLVGELGLNLAGVQLALGLFNQLLDMRTRLDHLQGKALKSFLEESFEEMLELLHARLP